MPAATPCSAEEATGGWRATATFTADEAHQAAAADERHFYAVGNRTIGKYDRKTGERVAISSGNAAHLNSGFFWEGKLYCAHSNYPQMPERSEIMVLDPESMKLSEFHHFAGQEGSLTWAVRHDGAWWCHFAFYDRENSKSYLARFDEEWREQARWTWPAELIAKLGRHSISGGIWHRDQLLVTDHNNYVVYRIKLPGQGSVLELVGLEPTPLAGQGIAHDPLTDGLVGIVRKKKAVIFAERVPAAK